MKCQICQIRPESVGIIINGQYLKICTECKPLPQVSSGHARWARSIDAEDHEADIMQPYNKDGSINVRFATLYPKQAKALFSAKQIRDATLK